MEIILNIINKLILILFMMSTLNILKHIYFFVQAWILSDTDTPMNYILSRYEQIVLGLSLSYIVSTILTGFKL